MSRPSWDEYFMKMAFLASERSTCLRRMVGAVMVKNKQVLASGYNGTPSGHAHCEDTGCLRAELNVPSGMRHEICRGLHAEQNCILQCAKNGMSSTGAVLYITNSPCVLCAKEICNTGIIEVVYAAYYPDEAAERFLEASQVAYRQLVVEGIPKEAGRWKTKLVAVK